MYVTAEGRVPFEQWLNEIPLASSEAVVLAAIDSLGSGEFRDCYSIGGGVFECRTRSSLGYRVYFALVGDDSLLLLGGGAQKSAKDDAKKALAYWQEFKAHAH